MTNAAHLYKIGRLEDAAQICAAILQAQHENFDALHLLGVIRWTQGRLQEALTLQETALAAKPESYGANTYIGVILAGLGRFEEAIHSYRRALAIKPDYAEVHNNLGTQLYVLKRYEEAIASYNNPLSIKPDYADAHRNKGFAWLAMGDFDTGWPEYEWRWGTAHGLPQKRSFTQPLWLGMEDIAGKTILLHGEQGLGDTIQFARYLPLVASMAARSFSKCKPD